MNNIREIAKRMVYGVKSSSESYISFLRKCGCSIGDNVIIGAGSVVTKDCESNNVYAGNPAHKIMTLEDYYSKRIKAQAEEAKILALKYFERYGKKPDKKVFHEYFMLFSSKKDILENPAYIKKVKLCGNSQDSLEYIKCNSPQFDSFEEFMRYCFNEK